MTTTAPRLERGAAPPDTSAHGLAVWASLAGMGADLALMAVIGQVVPPLVGMAVLTAIAVAVARRRPRAGLVALAVIAVLSIVGGAPFLVADLRAPSDPIAFTSAVIAGGGRIVAIAAVVLALRGRRVPARRVGRAAAAVLVVAVAGSLLTRASVGSEDIRQGDVEVVAEGHEFPGSVVVPADGVLFLSNRDTLRHTFAVEGTDVDVLMPPGTTRRHPVGLDVGTYTFVCSVPGHESMTGTLEVR